MMLNRFKQDQGGSASRWFALTAALVALAAVAGVQGMSHRTQDPARTTVFAPPAEAARSVSAGIDMTPIGVIKPASETRPAP